MKKIVYSLFLILTGVATLVSCQKDEADFSLSAVIADKPNEAGNPNAKVYIDPTIVNEATVYYARWHNGDIVNINNQPCTLSVSSTSAAAYINNITPSAEGYTAVYPYSEGAVAGAGATTATVTIPATQTYHTAQANGSSGASYQVVDGPMVARCASGDNVLKFHNAAGIIRVHVNNTTAETLKVHYVSVESSDGSYLAGSGTVNAASETPKLAEIASNGSKSVTLDCCDDATDKHPEIAPSGSMDFYLAVAPFSGKQLKIKVMTEKVEDDGKYKYIFSSNTTQAGGLSLDRNEISSVSMSLKAANRQELLFYGAGTKDCPFLISSYDDLNQLRTIVNSGDATAQSIYNTNQIHYLQTANINVGENDPIWGANISTISYSIGYSKTYPFKANYNGDNHSVYLSSAIGSNCNPSIDYGIGLFGVASDGGSISNITTTGSISSLSKNNTIYGGIVGLISGNFRLSNCTSNVYLDYGSHSDTYAGGIVGYIDASGCTIRIEDCIFSNTFNSTKDRGCKNGGICAYINAATKVVFDGCSTAERAGTFVPYLGNFGGICGYSNAPTEFKNCTNNWNIENTAKIQVGGIIAYSSSTITIENCTNNGDISCSTYVGGIIGRSDGAVTIKGTTSNTGDITAATTYAAGIIAYPYSTIDITTNLSTDTVKNSGEIKGQSSLGGIIGYARAKITINGNVKNTGAVTGSSADLGGIIGHSQVACDINKDCSDLSKKIINKGAVTYSSTYGSVTTTSGTGGVIGTAIGELNIRNCYNESRVSNKAHVGGIVGCVNISNASTITDCLNTGGTIYGRDAADYGVGGIVGGIRCSSHANGIIIKNCGNEGAVNGVNGYGAGIVGFSFTNGIINEEIYNCYCNANVSGKYVGGIITVKKNGYNLNTTISNCYYNGTLTGSTCKGSVSYTAASPTSHNYTFCYSDSITTSTPATFEGNYTSTGVKNATRTFNPTNGKFSAIGTNFTDANWYSGRKLVDALDAKRTVENGYRQWVVPAGKTLPTLGL